jgi:catecholate siderophore receptor
MDSERKHSAYLDDVRRRATPGDFTPAYITTNGDQLAFTPNVSGNIWTTYRLPFGLTVGGGVQYVGSSYQAVRMMRPASFRMASSVSSRPIPSST